MFGSPQHNFQKHQQSHFYGREDESGALTAELSLLHLVIMKLIRVSRSEGIVGLFLCTLVLLKCCFTSTETVGLIGTGAQDVHLDFHTAPELCALWP